MLKQYLRTIPLIITCLFVFMGCATQVVETPSQITRSTTPFSEFKKVVLVKAKIAETYADHSANIKATKKIDEVLDRELKLVFEQLTVITQEEAEKRYPNNKADDSVLLIKPLIKQIKFINGGARFFAGAMAGSSVVIMDTAFIDGETGQTLSNPGYYRKAGAYTDGFGISSNIMLDNIAKDVASYARTNY